MTGKTHESESIKYWLKFFFPAYVFFLSLYVLFYLGFLDVVGYIGFSFYSLIAIALAVILQERFPQLFSYMGRNAYHSFGGILIVVFGLFFVDAVTLVFVLSSVFLLFAVGTITEWFNIETMFSRGHIKRHVENFSKSSHYVAGTHWLFSCILLLILFNVNIAFASILILAIGDTAASFLGSSIGKLKNPLNSKKTVEGTLAFFSTSVFVAMLFVPTPTALLVAFLSAIIEALPLGINDNVAVPLSAGLFMFLFSYVI